MPVVWAYNTSGLADHRLDQAIDLVADLGYRGIAITIDHHRLGPFDKDLADQLRMIRMQLADRGLQCAIETGARYLLDPWRKHQPTLLSASPVERQVRIDFLRHAIDVAAELQATCVSLWTGAPLNSTEDDILWDRLAESLQTVLLHATKAGVRVAMEPEPDMFVATVADFDRLLSALAARSVDPTPMGMTVDVGHLTVQGEPPLSQLLQSSADRVVNLHLDDSVAGRHEHLPLGAGEVNFADVVGALIDAGYNTIASVELGRHSHRGPELARQSIEFLRACYERCNHERGTKP